MGIPVIRVIRNAGAGYQYTIGMIYSVTRNIALMRRCRERGEKGHRMMPIERRLLVKQLWFWWTGAYWENGGPTTCQS